MKRVHFTLVGFILIIAGLAIAASNLLVNPIFDIVGAGMVIAGLGNMGVRIRV